MWSSINSNDFINSISVTYEPYVFETDSKDYSLHINKENAKNNTINSLGAYESYSNNEYYNMVKTTLKPHITKPYQEDGKFIITCAYPIIYENTFLGAISANIDIENSFNNLIIDSKKYPTMFSQIVDNDLNIVYNKQYNQLTNKNLSEITNSKELEYTKNNISKNEPFFQNLDLL